MCLVVVLEDHPLHARLLEGAGLPGCAMERYADGLEASRRLADPARARSPA
jgi:hypothetical protein